MGDYLVTKGKDFIYVLALVYTCILTTFAGCCDKKSIPTRIQSLYSEVPKERNDAALELARCGGSASFAVSRLSELLYDENIGVQSAAAYALRQIDTKEAREALRLATSHKKVE